MGETPAIPGNRADMHQDISVLEGNTIVPLIGQWEASILRVIKNHLPDVHYVSVSGSFVSSRFNAGSDIDVLALTHGQEHGFHTIQLQCAECDNRMLEVTVLPLFRLIQYVDYAPRAGLPGILEEISNGRVLIDRENLAPIIRQKAMKLLAAGPLPVDYRTRQELRSRVADRIANARFADDPLERHLGVWQLISVLMEAVLIGERCWRGGSQDRYRWRRLKMLKTGLAISLRDAIEVAISTGSYEAVFLVSEHVLNAIGGPPEHGFIIPR